MGKYEEIVDMWRGLSATGVDVLMDNFRVLFAYNSNKIENSETEYHDTREIFENGRAIGFTGNPRTLFEIGNQKLCYEYLKKKLDVREPITVGLVLEVHGILTSGTYDEQRYIERGERPGTFKKHDYVTGKAEVGSQPEDVEKDVAELLKEVYGNEDSTPLLVAAYFHLRFEYIHPFADGNGRVGRTLMNYYLMTHDHPPVIVHDEDKGRYYRTLEKYDAEETIDGMCDFLREQTEKTWTERLWRSEGVGGTSSGAPMSYCVGDMGSVAGTIRRR
ncbi:MAG: Fic family protein [Oscillospiraceae bacterium]|jgi:Fic family protein|nr:Fic family protein [Oscillospiraceae bacterium]